MTVPALSLSPVSPAEADADVLVLGVAQTEDGPRLTTDDPAFASLASGLSALGATGARDQLRRIPAEGVAAGSIALIGLGSGTPTPDALRYAAGSATRQLAGAESIALALPAADEAQCLAVLEGAALGAYSYTEYRVASLGSAKQAPSVVTVLSALGGPALAERAATVAAAVHAVRDLVNTPPSDLYPATLAERVLELADGLPIEATVLDEAGLADGGFGGILSVGQGSARGPRLVKLSYAPAGARAHLALVGKGITFDTGGLSLKPGTGMVGMKYDMTGAASVAATVVAAARLAVPVRLTAWLCIAENMPSGSALRPNDVLRIRGGRTVEVLNTDAEGRLVMADGLAAASEEFPDAIVDIATLTGAARVALGERYAAVMGDEAFTRRVTEVATATGELVWPMPLPPELRTAINSDVADLANARIGNPAGGMLLAGVFLQEFVGSTRDGGSRIPWAHLDIAGPANNSGGGYGYTAKGPTGVLVRTLIALAEDISRA